MLWAYLDFTRLSLDLSGFDSSDIPSAVYNQHDNIIVQRCDLAAKQGIKPGMGLAQAAALCPDISITTYSLDKEQEHLQALAARLYQVASDIVVITPAALAIRLDNLCHYYGSISGTWKALLSELVPVNVSFAYATGWSVEAARILAKASCNQIITDNKAISAALKVCQVCHLDIDNAQKLTLNRVGIFTLDRLLSLSVSELGKRFNNQTIRYLTAVRGDVYPTYPLYRPADVFERHCDVAYEIEYTDHLLPYITTLLEDLAVFLRLRNKVVSEICLTLYYRDEVATELVLRSAIGLSSARKWLDIATLQLENISLLAPVISLRLFANELQEHDSGNQDFFQDRHQYFAQKQLMSRLQARLGEQSVIVPSSGNDHRMERQTESGENSAPLPSSQWLPAIRLVTPTPLTKPCHITFGPVRLQTGWWDERAVRRDYFIAKTQAGEYLQVFRNAQQHWFIQGYYA